MLLVKAIEKIYHGTAAVRKNLDIGPPYDSGRKLITTKPTNPISGEKHTAVDLLDQIRS